MFRNGISHGQSLSTQKMLSMMSSSPKINSGWRLKTLTAQVKLENCKGDFWEGKPASLLFLNTPPKTNMEPENPPLKEKHLTNHPLFGVPAVRFRGCNNLISCTSRSTRLDCPRKTAKTRAFALKALPKVWWKATLWGVQRASQLVIFFLKQSWWNLSSFQ